MSLGLNDLNKTRKPAKKKAEAETVVAKVTYPAGAWARSTTARPWSSENLQATKKNGRQRPEPESAPLNDDWIPLGVSGESHSRLTCLHERLAAVEEKIQTALEGPLQLFRLVFRYQR